MTGFELRDKRVSARIFGAIVCLKGDVGLSRLSGIEREYVLPTPEELTRINSALDELVRAKSVIQQTAAALDFTKKDDDQ